MKRKMMMIWNWTLWRFWLLCQLQLLLLSHCFLRWRNKITQKNETCFFSEKHHTFTVCFCVFFIRLKLVFVVLWTSKMRKNFKFSNFQTYTTFHCEKMKELCIILVNERVQQVIETLNDKKLYQAGPPLNRGAMAPPLFEVLLVEIYSNYHSKICS